MFKGDTRNNRQPLIVLAGPTGVGKSEVSLQIAKAVGGAILSADSMQVYRGLDIGSAKLPEDRREGIPHFLIDVLDPEEACDVVRYQAMAMEAIDDCVKKGLVPILTGGTGFYIQAVVRNIDFSDGEGDHALRTRLEAFAREHGVQALHEKLAGVDPVSAETIHANNIRRTIRALEFFYQTGTPISAHNRVQREKETPFDLSYFVLSLDRARLYPRIDARVDEMMADGLEREVRALAAQGLTEETPAMKGIGYSEFFPYFRGEIDLEEVVRRIKRDSRHYAKRQFTWFKREPQAVWIDRGDHERVEEVAEAILRILHMSRSF